MELKNAEVLLLAPHTDDAEFGCGGTIARLIEEGAHVHYAAFSVCEQSVPRHLPKETLEGELRNACKVLEIPNNCIHVFRYEVRKFPQFRQDILEDLIELKNLINPQLVFLPSVHDTHQDHQVISDEGFRAFKECTLLGYEMPWNNLSFTTSCFFHLEERHVNKKVEAMKCYQSQSFRPYASESVIFSLAEVRGIQIKANYAESFELIRAIF